MMSDNNQINEPQRAESNELDSLEEIIGPKNEYICPYPGCNETFYRKNNLTNHFKAHVFLYQSNTKKYECNINSCNKKFCSESHLNMHLSFHNINEAFYQCINCGKSYKEKPLLDEHKKMPVLLKSMILISMPALAHAATSIQQKEVNS